MNIQINISLCRVCMKSEIGKSMLEDELLHAKFESVTQLRVQNGDNLPALICEKCVLLLNLSHKFIQSAHETEKNLKSFLAKINNDFKLVTENASEASAIDNSDEFNEMLNLVCATECEIVTPDKFTICRKQSQIVATNEKSDENPKPIKNELVINENISQDTSLDEVSEAEPQIKVETCLLRADDYNSKNEQLLAMRDDIESLVDFETATDINSADSELMGLDAILVTDEDTVQLNEDHIQLSEDYLDEEHLKGVTYTEEYEALLEENSGEKSIIQYVSEESTVLQATDPDETNCNTIKSSFSSNFVELTFENITDTEAADKTLTKNENKCDLEAKKSIIKPKQAEILLEAEAKRFYCTQCKRDFSTKTNLTRHLALHDGKRPFQCEICLKGFSQNGTLKQHMYIHTGEKPHVCPVCKRGFTQSKSLVFHMRRHSGEKPHQCDYCKALFRQKDALKVHIFKHHLDAYNRVFSCKICNKEMGAQALRNHMKSHLNNHKPTAENVMKLFDETGLLSDSALMTDEVSFNVDGSTHVIDVMATSTTEPSRAKKYQCRKCFKCFAIKQNLIRHLSFHEVKPTEFLRCGNCSLIFDTIDALREHAIQAHDEIMVYSNECHECDMKFKNSVDLDIHMKSLHTFHCKQCRGMSFTSEKLLNDHLIEHNMKMLL